MKAEELTFGQPFKLKGQRKWRVTNKVSVLVPGKFIGPKEFENCVLIIFDGCKQMTLPKDTEVEIPYKVTPVKLTTVQEIYKNTFIADIKFADKRAVDIYRQMQFKAEDGKTYDAWNVYVSGKDNVRISVSASQWWNPLDVVSWIPDTLGEGMRVITPSDGIGIILVIQPNRACHVRFLDGTQKSYRESDLKGIYDKI